MPGSVAESTGGTQPNLCAIRKGGAQSSGALGCRSQGGGVTTPVVKEMENSLLTLPGRRGKHALITASGDLVSEPLALLTEKTVGEGAGWKSQGDPDCERQVQRYGQNGRGLDKRSLQFGFRVDIS